MKRLEIIGLEGLGEVQAGDSIAQLICDACARANLELEDEDVLVVAHKVVSKAEGRVIGLDEIEPSPRAL